MKVEDIKAEGVQNLNEFDGDALIIVSIKNKSKSSAVMIEGHSNHMALMAGALAAVRAVLDSSGSEIEKLALKKELLDYLLGDA